MSSTVAIPNFGIFARRRQCFAGGLLVALVAVLVAFALTAPVGAQSVYGDSSNYGAETYNGGDAGEAVLPPNTGFGHFAQTALEQPLLIWGSGMLLTAAVMVALGRTRRRKQEN